jgi:hypothetical protein
MVDFGGLSEISKDLTVYEIVYRGPDGLSNTACKSLKDLVSAEGIESA